MKKVITFVAIAGSLAFVACGPSAADKAKAHMADSLRQDSINNAQKKAMADAQKKHDDSVKAAMPKDSMAKDTAAKK